MWALETFDAEQTGDAGVSVDALNGLAKQRRNGEYGNRESTRVDGYRVGRDELIDEPATQALVSNFVKDAVADRGADAASAVFAQHFGRSGQGTGSFGDVVDEEYVAAFHFADDINRFDGGRIFTFLGDQAEAGAEDIGVRGGHFHATNIGRAHDEFVAFGFVEVVEEHWRGKEVVDRDVEKPLNLLTVQIHGEDAIGASGDEQVGHEFRRDGHAGLILTVLPGVAVKREYGRDTLSRGATRGIDHDEQLHQMMVGRRAGRLDDVRVMAADIFVNFNERFTVGKTCHRGLAQGHANGLTDRLGEGPIRVTRKNFQSRFAHVEEMLRDERLGGRLFCIRWQEV